MVTFLLVLAQMNTDESGNSSQGLLGILATLIAIVIVIGIVWTIVAKRGSRTPRRDTHDHDVGRSG